MDTWEQSSECPEHQTPAASLPGCSAKYSPLFHLWIRSRHKAKSPHNSYGKAMKAQDDPVSNQTLRSGLTSQPDSILSSLLSSIHFRCRERWHVNPNSIEGQMLLPMSSINCSSLLSATNPELHIFLWLPCFCTQQCILMPVHSLLRHSPSFSPSAWQRLAGNYPVQKFVAIFPYVLPWEWNFQPKCCKSQSHKLIQSCKKRKPRSEVFTT